jgi:hypothetical protein
MEQTPHIKILYSLMTLLLVVVVVLMGIVLYRPQMGTQVGQLGSNGLNVPAAQAATSTPVGNGGPISSYTTSGTIITLTSSSIQIKTADGSIASLAVDPNTKFETLGPVKSAAEMQTEMDAYNAQVATLMKDLVKNKAALAALPIPLPQTHTATTAADFKAGDQVEVAAVAKDSSGAYIAYSIVKGTSQ